MFSKIIFPYLYHKPYARRYEIETEYDNGLTPNEEQKVRGRKGHGSVCLKYHLDKGRLRKVYFGRIPHYVLTDDGVKYYREKCLVSPKINKEGLF